MHHKKASSKKCRKSDDGQIVSQKYSKEYRDARREIKKTNDLAITIKSLGGVTAGEIAEQVMNAQQPNMRSTTVHDYAINIGGVYIWYTELDDVHGVDFESTRFITQGQDSLGEGKGNHNSVLMWNPRHMQFLKNICPYKERFDHGFQKIDKKQCSEIGIEYVALVDAAMTRTEALKIEKVCQTILNDLHLGKQRLHSEQDA
jgi:hypothetical protein